MRELAIPRHLLSTPELASYERAHRLLWCAREAAEAEGLYRAGGTVARLRRGELLATHELLATAWGVSRDHARKVLDSLRRVGALDWREGGAARVPGFPPPTGTLIRLAWVD